MGKPSFWSHSSPSSWHCATCQGHSLALAKPFPPASCFSLPFLLPQLLPPAPKLWQSLHCVGQWVLASAKCLWDGTHGWRQAVVPLVIPRPIHTSLGTRNSWELLWELASRPGERETGMLAMAGQVSSNSVPLPQPHTGVVSGPGDKTGGSLGRGREDRT